MVFVLGKRKKGVWSLFFFEDSSRVFKRQSSERRKRGKGRGINGEFDFVRVVEFLLLSHLLSVLAQGWKTPLCFRFPYGWMTCSCTLQCSVNEIVCFYSQNNGHVSVFFECDLHDD